MITSSQHHLYSLSQQYHTTHKPSFFSYPPLPLLPYSSLFILSSFQISVHPKLIASEGDAVCLCQSRPGRVGVCACIIISLFAMSKSEKRKYSGFPGDCSQQQLKALEEFREMVRVQNGGKLDVRWDDVYLLRFLRARKFNLKDTDKMWRDYIDWRVKNGVDKLHVYYFPQLLQLRKVYPHGYHKHDRKYRPIYIERLGFTNPEEIWTFTSADRLLSYYGMLYETLTSKIFQACTEQKRRETGDGSRVMQTCTILDLKDIKLSNASAAYKFVKPASEMAQNNYPEILGNMFILNAPFLFTGIWAIVKMWIDDKTKEKIQILGSSYKKELLRYVDPENLPDFLEGGTCKCKQGCLGINIGPWNPQGKEFFPHCLQQAKEEKEERFNFEKGETEKLEKVERALKAEKEKGEL